MATVRPSRPASTSSERATRAALRAVGARARPALGRVTGPRSRRAWFGASLVAGVLAGAWLAAGHDAFPAAEPRRAAVEPRAGSAIASRISPGAAARVAADGESAAASGGAVAVNALPAAVARRAPSAEATRIEQALDDLAGTGVGGDAAPALVLAVNAALGDADSGVREVAGARRGARGAWAPIGVLLRGRRVGDAPGRAAAGPPPRPPPERRTTNLPWQRRCPTRIRA